LNHSKLDNMNKPRTPLAGPLVTLVAGLLVSCGSLPQAGVVPIAGLDAGLGELPPAVDIQNHRGSVTLVVDPKARGPMITAVPRTTGALEKEVRWTAASMSMDNGRPVLRVLSTPEDTGAPDVPVALSVTIPSCGGVRIHNNGGPVVLRGVGGAIEVQTSLSADDLIEKQAIFLETDQPLTGPVLLRADRGDIEVRMPRASAGQIFASAPGGTVAVDGARAELRSVHYAGGTYIGTLNAGQNEQRISTERGDVRVLVGIPDAAKPWRAWPAWKAATQRPEPEPGPDSRSSEPETPRSPGARG
jgi:hypothetical protein